MVSSPLRRLAHTFAGAPKINYFPQLSKRKNLEVSQARGNTEQGRDKAATDFRSSLSDPDYVPSAYRSAQSTFPSSGTPTVVPAEGAANFTTPDMDPVRHSLMDPSYLEEKPAGMGRKIA